MKKFLFFLGAVSSLSILANPDINVAENPSELKYEAKIIYKDKSHWDKHLTITPTINILFITKQSLKREYFQCYDKFDLSLDGKKLIPQEIELESNGSRFYAEDLAISQEAINKIISQPKRYDETFTLVLNGKNLSEIENAQIATLTVCDKIEELSNAELQALKQTIIKSKEK